LEAISESQPSEIIRLGEIREGKVVVPQMMNGFTVPTETDDYVAEDFDEFDERKTTTTARAAQRL
jgi:hypothetical protein